MMFSLSFSDECRCDPLAASTQVSRARKLAPQVHQANINLMTFPGPDDLFHVRCLNAHPRSPRRIAGHVIFSRSTGSPSSSGHRFTRTSQVSAFFMVCTRERNQAVKKARWHLVPAAFSAKAADPHTLIRRKMLVMRVSICRDGHRTGSESASVVITI